MRACLLCDFLASDLQFFFTTDLQFQACYCSLQCTDSQLSVPRMCGGSCKFAVVELKDAFQGDRYVSSSWRLSPCIAILFDSFLLWTDVLLSCFYLFSWFFLSSCDYLNTQLKLNLPCLVFFSIQYTQKLAHVLSLHGWRIHSKRFLIRFWWTIPFLHTFHVAMEKIDIGLLKRCWICLGEIWMPMISVL